MTSFSQRRPIERQGEGERESKTAQEAPSRHDQTTRNDLRVSLARLTSRLTTCLAVFTVLFALASTARAASKAKDESANNSLAVGSQAKIQAVNLAINAPTKIDFKSRKEIESLRREFVFQHPELLLYRYEPYSKIFGQIVDGKPWWGLNGQLFYDSGNQSIEGLSEETRFINNPYLLVAANMVLDGYTFSTDRYASKADLARTALPLDCEPAQIYFYPPQAREDITYNVSNFLKESARYVDLPKQLSSAKFDLVAYNARDFGYNFLAVSPQYSRNISRTHATPVPINQFIHCGNSCGYPGGCNNMSPYSKELFDLTLGALPAQAVIYLWKKKPQAPSQLQRPDFMVILNFI